MTACRFLIGLFVLAIDGASSVAAPPAGPPPLFGSPGSVGSPQFSYPAPGVYGSTVFQPFAVPSLTGSPTYNVPLPPPGWRDELTAQITVRVPADAKLWVDGKPTKQAGAVREFVTPPVLRAGQTYRYHFRAEWSEDGRTVSRDRPVEVQATRSVTVDFAKP